MPACNNERNKHTRNVQHTAMSIYAGWKQHCNYINSACINEIEQLWLSVTLFLSISCSHSLSSAIQTQIFKYAIQTLAQWERSTSIESAKAMFFSVFKARPWNEWNCIVMLIIMEMWRRGFVVSTKDKCVYMYYVTLAIYGPFSTLVCCSFIKCDTKAVRVN